MSTEAMKLLELAARCEAMKEPDRELDAAITVTLGIGARGLLPDDHEYLSEIRKDDSCAPGTYWFKCRSGASLRTAEEFTASLDAAMTLVPPSYRVSAFADSLTTTSSGNFYATLMPRAEDCSLLAAAFSSALPRALTAAALRARAFLLIERDCDCGTIASVAASAALSEISRGEGV